MRRWLSLFFVLVFITTTGCSLLVEKNEETPGPLPINEDEPEVRAQNLRETIFYFPDENLNILIPVRMYILREAGIARATLRYCTDGYLPVEAVRAGLAPLLPSGTTVLGLAVNDGVARVDFSKEFLTYPIDSEDMLLKGLIYTLTEFPTINKVEILVENTEQKLHGGTSSALPLTREFGLNLEIDESAAAITGTLPITLYYLYDTGECVLYVPITRVVKKTEDWLKKIATELLRGPQSGSILFTGIPAGMTLKAVTQAGSKVSVHLEGDLDIEGGQTAADRMRQQVALTFTEIDGITEVAILVNDQLPDFGPGISFPPSFGRPQQWNLLN